MFYYIFYPFREHWIIFNLFKYITFRSAGACISAFLICLLLGPWMIRWLQGLDAVGTVKRKHAEKIHTFYQYKRDIPTMGGILILSAIVLATLIWGDLGNRLVLMGLLTLVWFGGVGFADDCFKIRYKSSSGLRSGLKLLSQILWGGLLAIYLYHDPKFNGTLYIPFFKNVILHLGILYVPFVIVVLAGSSNALNLTDGLDGLAIGCMSFVAAAFAILSYVSGHVVFAEYLKIPFFEESGELTVLCSAMVGAGVGFLWYNCYPATIFMGDTGSLSLGGALGVISVLIKKELVLLIVGGVFVWEAMSVIIQVASYKLFKKRIFLMAPYHHHLQLAGWPESKVTVRLWIVAFMLALLGLGTLKVR